MKIQKICCNLCLLFSLFNIANAEDIRLGTELKKVFSENVYYGCIKEKRVKSLVKELGVSKHKYCICLELKAEEEFKNQKLEQRYNLGNISIKDMMSEMRKIGEKIGEYCEIKLTN